MKSKYYVVGQQPIQASPATIQEIAGDEPVREISGDEYWAMVSAKTSNEVDDEDPEGLSN